MAQVTYNDKVALNENQDIADINKVKASDMNEIKEVVNANDKKTTDIDDSIGLSIDTYSNEKTYNVNDKVIYNNKIYKCITEISVAEEFDEEKWELVPIISDKNINVELLPVLYSSEEHVIGIDGDDGRKIYEKKIILGNVTTSLCQVSVDIENFDKMTDLSGGGYLKNQNGGFVPWGFANSGGFAGCYYQAQLKKVEATSSYELIDAFAILRYKKIGE